MTNFNEVSLVILDIDGVIYNNHTIVQGASEAVMLLRKHGLVVKFLTNDAISSRSLRAQELNALGFDVLASDIYTATSLTAHYLQLVGSPRTLLLLEGEGKQEFQELPIVEYNPQCVVVGDCFNSYSFDKLNRAFIAIRNGAIFIAMQRNRCWSIDGDLVIDTGFWVAGLLM